MRVCFWEELGDDEQWWNSMVVAERGVVEKQRQESSPPAWPGKDEGVPVGKAAIVRAEGTFIG